VIPPRRKPAVDQGQEGRGAGRRLIREERRIGQAGPIVDGDGEELHATAAAAPAMIAVNAVAHPAEAAQLLDVQVDQLAREGAFIPADRWGRRAGPAREAEAPLDVHHSRQRQIGDPGRSAASSSPTAAAG
jgi:hypothetical protein